MSYGLRMLMRSAEVQLEGEQGQSTGGNNIVIGVALFAALVIFIGVPYVATNLARAAIPSSVVLNIVEGVIRLVLLIGYLIAISFMPDVRRVFAYHGAEHMTIHAFEHGDPLLPERIAPYPTAHPRCGTAFLLFVAVVAIALFAFLPRVNLLVDLITRLLLVVPVASISYEVLRLGAAHERLPVMRVLIAPGLLLQRITTRRPDARMIEVAVASLEEKNVIVELRAGEGGEEAALFAGDLYKMYLRYAERHRWKTEELSASRSEKNGFKEVIFRVAGKGAYSKLKFESGVHRVQRVPATEAQGRIHTSTATVAVLPEAEETDLVINDEDLKIDVYRAGGHGGQGVNTTDSAVRITHLPTGEVVTCQDERSQLKNKAKAMAVLRARLLARAQEEREAEESTARRAQIGRGERAEKMRTYNYPQDRITDRRLGYNISNLERRMDGDIDDLIDALAAQDEADRLSTLEEDGD